MKNLEYKGYTGSIEYSKEDDVALRKSSWNKRPYLIRRKDRK